MENPRPNYNRFASSCSSCDFFIAYNNIGCGTTDCYCNIDKEHPYPVDDCGICDNFERDVGLEVN